MKIAITGARGFVGGHLAAQLGAIPVPFRLEAAAAIPELERFDALIHAAWDFTATDTRNVSGSIRLFEYAAAAGVRRILFISSLSAFEGCRSVYGKTKLTVEGQLNRSGGCGVRLGFVCDGSGRGLSGGLRRLARLPLLPLPGMGNQVLYTIQAEDLGAAFRRILAEPCGGPVSLAHPEPVTLKRMLQTFAREEGSNPRFLSCPWQLMYSALRAAELSGARLRFRSDSLLSLMNQNPSPDFSWLYSSGLLLQPFPLIAR